jgi:hypothetical protein
MADSLRYSLQGVQHTLFIPQIARNSMEFIMARFSKLFVSAALLAIGASTIGNAFAAETQWQKNHPRRVEVNQRLNHQNARINHKVKEGEMTHGQAAKLKTQDHQIRQEERAMANQNNGHITKQEQKTLNQQENAFSKKIGH